MSAGARSSIRDATKELPAMTLTNAINQTVSVSGASAQSAAFNQHTSLIRVFGTVDFFIEEGVNPTATTGSTHCAAGIYHFFGVKSGNKVAVIRLDTDGTVYICEGGN